MNRDNDNNYLTSNKVYDNVKNKWRIVIGNINSFPNEEDGKNKYKLETLKKLVMRKHTEIVMISEHNRNLSKLANKNQPTEIIKCWWNHTIVRASFFNISKQICI
jgi:hypothetical protein